MDGIYTYCFGNKMSTMTPKVVLFTVDIVLPNHSDDKNVEQNGKQENGIIFYFISCIFILKI